MKKETLHVGDRVQVCIGSGIDSEKHGTILNVNRGSACVEFDGTKGWSKTYMSPDRLIKEGEAWRPTFRD